MARILTGGHEVGAAVVIEELRRMVAERVRLVIQQPLGMVAAVTKTTCAAVAAGNLPAVAKSAVAKASVTDTRVADPRLTYASVAKSAVMGAEMLARERVGIVMRSA